MPLREPTPQEVFDQLNRRLNWGGSVITYVRRQNIWHRLLRKLMEHWPHQLG
jgi:hypothetical protein